MNFTTSSLLIGVITSLFMGGILAPVIS